LASISNINLRIRPDRYTLLLLIIICLCLLLRLINIADQSIWLDEAYSIQAAESGFAGILEKTTSEDFHPPLYYFLLHVWLKIFGNSEFSSRFISLIFSAAAVPIVYFIGCRLFSRQTGLLSALLLSISVFHIEYAQEVRGYSMLVFFSLLSIYYFIGVLRDKKFFEALAYIFFTLLLLYTHYFGALIVVCQNAYLFTLYIISRRYIRGAVIKWLILQLAIGIGYLPWLIVLARKLTQVDSTLSWITKPTLLNLLDTFTLYSSNSILLFLILLFLAFSVPVSLKKTEGKLNKDDLLQSLENYRWTLFLTETRPVWLLWLWIMTTVILPFIISLIWTPVYIDRVTITASVAFYLLAARGILKIPRIFPKIIVVAIITGVSLVSIWQYQTKTGDFLPKEEWRDAAAYVDKNTQFGDLLLFNNRYVEIPFNYYSSVQDVEKKPFPKHTKHINQADIEKLPSLIAGHQRIWVIFSHRGRNWKWINQTLVESGYEQADRKKYFAIELFLFTKN